MDVVSGEVVDGRPAIVGRFAARWRTDLSDVASVALLRARMLLAAALIGVPAVLGLALQSSRHGTLAHPETYGSTVVFLMLLAAFSWWRGPRMGDLTFALLIFAAYPGIGMGLLTNDPISVISMVAVCVMPMIIVNSLFIQRTWIAYAGIGLAIATVTAVTVAQPWQDRTTTEYVSSVLCIALVGVPMRLVRDLAISAIVQSRHLEATDALTGLQNRRGLERCGAGVWQRGARTPTLLSTLVLDIDHFKRINDEHGHAAGDEVLRRLGALLKDHTRAGDLTARLGGEEFLVLATCAPDSADVFAERLRRTIETELAPVTVSIGVHTQLPAQRDPWPAAMWTMVNHADHALYRAKAAGRNRVVVTTDTDAPAAVAQHVPLPAPRTAASSVDESGAPLPGSAPGRRRSDLVPGGPIAPSQ